MMGIFQQDIQPKLAVAVSVFIIIYISLYLYLAKRRSVQPLENGSSIWSFDGKILIDESHPGGCHKYLEPTSVFTSFEQTLYYLFYPLVQLEKLFDSYHYFDRHDCDVYGIK